MEKEKPDNVADSPGLMPYGTNIGAPSIKPDDEWKMNFIGTFRLDSRGKWDRHLEK